MYAELTEVDIFSGGSGRVGRSVKAEKEKRGREEEKGRKRVVPVLKTDHFGARPLQNLPPW